jgi:hypothetical protein
MPTACPAFSIASSACKGEGLRLLTSSDREIANSFILWRFDIELASEKKSRADRVYTVGRIPITPHAEIVAATLVVEVVAKTAQLSVLKANAGETGSPWYG